MDYFNRKREGDGMTIEERNIKLKHLITCMKCEVSGKVCDSNCPTQYEAGNMGEIIENLEAISSYLSAEEKESTIISCSTCPCSHITMNNYLQCKLTGNCYVPSVMTDKISEECPIHKRKLSREVGVN